MLAISLVCASLAYSFISTPCGGDTLSGRSVCTHSLRTMFVYHLLPRSASSHSVCTHCYYRNTIFVRTASTNTRTSHTFSSYVIQAHTASTYFGHTICTHRKVHTYALFDPHTLLVKYTLFVHTTSPCARSAYTASTSTL
jgi:hypothetical protein